MTGMHRYRLRSYLLGMAGTLPEYGACFGDGSAASSHDLEKCPAFWDFARLDSLRCRLIQRTQRLVRKSSCARRAVALTSCLARGLKTNYRSDFFNIGVSSGPKPHSS